MLNQEKPYFKRKFGRDPKQWTIEMVHDIWRRSVQRSERRRNSLLECIDEIVNTIESFDGDRYIVYFNHNDRICKYTFSKSYYGDGYSYSKDIVEFENNNTEVIKRDEKLAFILSNKNAFEIGEKFHRLNLLCSYQHSRVYEILNNMINVWFRNNVHGIKFEQKVLTIEISNIFYYISVENTYLGYDNYFKVKLLNEVNTPINIPTYV